MHSFSLNVNPCLSCVVLFLFLGLSLTTTSQTCNWDYLGSQAISSGTGEWTDIEYNPVTGEPYVAFQDESLGERITVMKYDGSTWSVVGTAGFSEGQSFNPDLEFDSSGTPYVSYRHFPAFGYSVQMFDGTDWVILGASDFTGDANGNGSLAVDPVSGDLYIAYPDLNSGLANKLTVQRWDGTSWSLVGMQGFTTDGTAYPDIKVDATGTPYVMFTSTNSFALNLQVFGGTFWTTVGTANFSPNSPSSASYSAAFEFNPVTGDPTIVSRVNGNVIDVFTYDGVSWTDDTLPNYGNSGSNQRFGFEFDNAGNIYFAIKRNAGTPVFAASVISNKGGSWDYVGNAVISEDLADYVALALNPSGEPVIAFHDNSPGGGGAISVMEASCAIQGCTDPTACNYNSEATQDDGSCLTVQGCTDPLACNYDASAECEDGSCLLPDGCTDPGAYNYDPAATCDDGSCTDFGSALNFNGIGTNSDYISVPTDASVEFGSGAFTIETWFRMEPANDFSSLLAAYNVSNGGWAFHRDEPENGANNVRWIVGNSASTGNFESIYSGPLNFNEWYHIAGVRDDNELRLYVNGVLVGTTPASRNLPTLPLLLGRRYGDVPQWGHNGDLDEVRLWDRALNEDEINARMNCELNGDEPGLVRYFKLNQGEAFGDNTSITTATSDQLTNPVDGSLVGFELTGTQANFVVGQSLDSSCPVIVYGCTDLNSCSYDPSAFIDDGSCTYLGDPCDDMNLLTFNDELQSDCSCAGVVAQTPTPPGSGDALSFDGIDDSVVIPASSEMNPASNSFTVSAWFKNENLNAGTIKIILSKYGFGGINGGLGGLESDSYSLFFNETGFPAFSIRDESNGAQQLTATTFVQDNEWHHIAAVRDVGSGFVRLYIDGIEMDSAALSVLGDISPSNDFRIGSQETYNSNSPQYHFDGSIDEVRYWSVALTEEQIRDFMCQKDLSSHVDISNLEAYYRFDDGAGSNQLFDLSGNGHSGTLSNMDLSSAWITSGAAIGDLSTQAYGEGSLILIDGTSFTVDDLTGSPEGVHIYKVNEAPNNVTVPGGFSSLETTAYYGVHVVGGETPTYTATLDYTTNANIDGAAEEPSIRLVTRFNNAAGEFANPGSQIVDIASNMVSVENQSNTEYIPGFIIEVFGCLNPLACNYDGAANTDDGSCILPDGCTDPNAANYDHIATCDDGSCYLAASGLNMNNDDDRVFLSDLSGFNASEFSMQMMVYLDAIETSVGYTTLFHIGNQGSSSLELYTQSSNHVVVLFNRDQPGIEYRQFIAPPTDEWVLVSLVFDVDEGPQVFYNGLPAVQTDNVGAWDDIPVIPADGAFYIGHMPSNSWAQCCAPRIIDECRIWNRRLSEQEVGLLGDCEIDGTDPDLFAHYSFNQGGIGIDNTGIDVVIDQTGNGRDGALLNMALNGTSSNWAEGSDLILDVCAALAPGCTDPAACNYDANATSDDGSCQLPDGCTDPSACNYDANAECDDGSCDFVSCQGCTDPSACNYDPTATNDDGTCELPIIIDLGEDQEICSGDEVTLDAGAGFLNYLWSTGETTQTITVDSPGSYSVEATYGVGNPVINSQSYETFFNSGRVDIPSWFIPSENTVGGLVEFPLPTNIIGWNTLFGQGGAIHPILIRDDGQLGLFNMATGFGDSGYNVSSLAPGYHQIAAVASGGSTTFYVDGVEVGTTNSVTFGSLTAMGNIISGTQPAGVIDNMFISASALTAEQIEANRCGLDPDSPSMVLYYDFENVSGTSVQDISGNGNDGIIVGGALPTGEDLGCNLGCTSFDEVSITLKPEGCTDPSACNYDANAECDNGSCILPDGCTDNTACNYDPAALCDDGSCDFTSCVGCTDPLADNYEADNTVEDGSCTYCPATLTYNTTIPEPIVIGNGISNDHMAQSANCNVSASIKAIERFVGDIIPTDGLYRVQTGESPVSGIDPTPDPGTARWNYLFSVNLGSFTAEDVKIYLDLDFDPAIGAGTVYTADVSQVLIDNGLGGSSLAQDSQNLGFGFWQLLGDPAILPFDPFANGLYDLTIRVESLAGVELVNAAIQVETFTLGCTNPIACNYDSNATDDDGSCLDILGCTDSGACNYDPTANCDDASCEYTSCLGCTDPTSCDYDPTATIDDGSCLIFPGDACDDGNVYTENDQIQADCGCEGTPIDTDGDGISDEDEINVYGTDPNLQDSDYDGLTDGLEIHLAGTNPLDPDSDDDGCGDAESFAGLCPGQEDCIGDFNNDGIVNGADLLTFLGVFGTPCE